MSCGSLPMCASSPLWFSEVALMNETAAWYTLSLEIASTARVPPEWLRRGTCCLAVSCRRLRRGRRDPGVRVADQCANLPRVKHPASGPRAGLFSFAVPPQYLSGVMAHVRTVDTCGTVRPRRACCSRLPAAGVSRRTCIPRSRRQRGQFRGCRGAGRCPSGSSG